MTYIDGYIIPVATANKDAYFSMARAAAPIFAEYGALHVVECWGDDMMRGKTTDFFMAVKAEPEENVVFSWIVWPDKATRDEGNKAAMADKRFEEMGAGDVFDGKRIVFSGFQVMVDYKA